jgi:hypothetical protein
MKKLFFVFYFIFSSFFLFAQSDSLLHEERLKFGFNLGINHSNLFSPDELPSYASIDNGIGFRLGVLADYQLFRFMSISPKAEMAFNTNALNLTFNEISVFRYEVMPISLEFMTHFTFRMESKRFSPYFYVGPNLKVPISGDSGDYPGHSIFAIDAGIGVEKAFKQFNFSPELRYSYGLTELSITPVIRSLKFHNISLIFNFK